MSSTETTTSGQVGGFKLQSFLKANRTGHEALLKRIAQKTDATKLTNIVLNSGDKKLSSSLYYVLGVTMTDESKALKIVRIVAVGEGAIALHMLLAGIRQTSSIVTWVC